MSIYVIGDLHLSFSVDKPMDVFGMQWENHAEKIKENWIKKVKDTDTVILPGDFSWATYLEETYRDFEFLNTLPGRKILLKGNHDYWWTTVTSMKKYLNQNQFENIDFLFNNAFLIDNTIISGTRGWINLFHSTENYKILKRENERLKLSLEKGVKEYGTEKEKIVFMHYPPFYKEPVPEEIDFIKTMKKYNVTKCYYGHLHTDYHKDGFEGIYHDIEFKLISSDYLDFDLINIK